MSIMNFQRPEQITCQGMLPIIFLKGGLNEVKFIIKTKMKTKATILSHNTIRSCETQTFLRGECRESLYCSTTLNN